MPPMGCALLLLAAIAGPAGAFFEAQVTQTLGSDDYSGTRLSADLGDVVHVQPAFSFYKSDLAEGTFKTVSARVAYDAKAWGGGVTMGGSPEVDGYSNRFFGFDGGWSFSPSGERLSRVELGAAVVRTTHRDRLQAGRRRRPAVVEIGQTDVGVNGGVSFLDTLFAAEVTVSSYDKDLEAIQALAAPTTRLAGLNEIVQGFPRASLNLRAELAVFPAVEPYVSLTRTTFKLGAPASTGVAAGATVDLEPARLHGAIERYSPGGGAAARTFVSFGAGVRF
ncbi:MAG: hypothetical protein HY554_09955 [Elusimicrobia bacterium]|nr:hypothetical protein [Elusimicrobiota bacterium]